MEDNQMTSVVIEQEGENKKRGALALILALAVVVVLGIGATFAYLTYTGNQTPNRFTTDAGISCDLLEPAWTDNIGTAYPAVASDGTKIPTAANNTKYASVIAKDPYVVNTAQIGNDSGDGVDEFVGIRLTFQKWVATSQEGSGSLHKENGQYVTMTDTEVEALMENYCFTSLAADKIDTTDASSDTGVTKVKDMKAGMNIDSSWIQTDLEGNVGNTVNGKSENGSMYFIYNAGSISSLGEQVTKDNDATKSAAQATYQAGKPTTTNLFKNVVQVTQKTDSKYKDFLSYLYKGSEETDLTPKFDQNKTTDPGWRVLVSAAAVDATDLELDADATQNSAIYAAINAAQVKLTKDGKSATVTGRDKAGAGSGYRSDVTIPEDEWTK